MVNLIKHAALYSISKETGGGGIAGVPRDIESTNHGI